MPRALQITQPAAQALSPAQKRFNTLLKRIEQARGTVAAWQRQVPVYLEAHVALVVPLLAQQAGARREWAFALGGLLDRPKGWTKAERETLTDLLCDAAGALLDEQDEPDAELKALYDRHADTDFDTEQLLDLQAMKDMAATMTGIDLGDDTVASREELMQRLQAGFAAIDAQDEAPEAAAAPQRRQRAAAQARRESRAEAEARAVTQSLREIYRKLASTLHPDRETDVAAREAKNALMQRANQAYAANDLLTLLELQLQTEQIDAGHMARASAVQLKHYNKVLAEQLEELQDEQARLEAEFRFKIGIGPGPRLNPLQLGPLLDEHKRALRGDLARQRQWMRMLDDPAATKRWLKAMRRQLQVEAMFDDDLPF